MGSTGSGHQLVIRKYVDGDYEAYSRLWTLEGEVCPPKPSLPENGIVVGDYDAVGFMANVDCDFGFMCWYKVNENLSNRRKYIAIRSLFITLEEFAVKLNKNYIFCFTGINSIINILESLGYVSMGSGHMGKKL